MVRKLMKHELRAIYRILLWLMLAALLLSVLTRVSNEMNIASANGDGSGILRFISVLFSSIFWEMGMFALAGAATLVSLVRYFKSLFTGEGYLTFSLPVTPTQLLIAKLLSALIATVSSFAVILLGLVIAIPFSGLAELFDEFLQFGQSIVDLFVGNPLGGIEALLLFLAAIPAGLLYLYLIASLGQLFTKGRTLITIGLYIGGSFVLQFLFSLFFPVIMHASFPPHLIAWIFIVLLAGFDFGSFFLIRYILSKKVNLVV